MSETPNADGLSPQDNGPEEWFSSYVTTSDLQLEHVEEGSSVAHLVNEFLHVWLEDDAPFAVLIRGQDGVVQATLFPGPVPTRAVVAYRDGRLEQYDVRYLTDSEGHYTGAEVTPVTT